MTKLVLSHDLPRSTITSQIAFDQRVLPLISLETIPSNRYPLNPLYLRHLCKGQCVRVFLCLIHKHVSTIPVVYELFPHSKVLSKSIIEPNVTMRFNKLFCESNHPLQEGVIWRTTLHAEWRVSMSDCSSFRVQDFLHSHLQRVSLMCLILSHGRPASSLMESMSMPRSSIIGLAQ